MSSCCKDEQPFVQRRVSWVAKVAAAMKRHLQDLGGRERHVASLEHEHEHRQEGKAVSCRAPIREDPNRNQKAGGQRFFLAAEIRLKQKDNTWKAYESWKAGDSSCLKMAAHLWYSGKGDRHRP